MPEALPPVVAAPVVPAEKPAQAPDRATARKARIDGVKAKGVDAVSPKTPAATKPVVAELKPEPVVAKPAAAAVEKPATEPAAKVEPPAKPAAPARTKLDELLDEAKALSAKGAPAAPKPATKPAPAAPVAAVVPAKEVEPTAAMKASIFKIAAENGWDQYALLRHFADELKAGRPLEFKPEPGAGIFDPARQRLDKTEQGYADLRKELDAVKEQNAKLLQTWEQREADNARASQSTTALSHLSSDAARWPLLNRNPDRNAIAKLILDTVQTVATNSDATDSTGKRVGDLTMADVLDRLEKYQASVLEPYKEYFAGQKPDPAASAAPKHPQPAAKTDGQVTTIAPGSVAPQAGELPARRRDSRSRAQRGIDFLHSGK